MASALCRYLDIFNSSACINIINGRLISAWDGDRETDGDVLS